MSKSLHTELSTARDEMNRQACLYAEASRHRTELHLELAALKTKLRALAAYKRRLKEACADNCCCTKPDNEMPWCPACTIAREMGASDG